MHPPGLCCRISPPACASQGPPTSQGLCWALQSPLLPNKHVNITYKTLEHSDSSAAPEEYRKFFLITMCVLNKDSRKQLFKIPGKGCKGITAAPGFLLLIFFYFLLYFPEGGHTPKGCAIPRDQKVLMQQGQHDPIRGDTWGHIRAKPLLVPMEVAPPRGSGVHEAPLHPPGQWDAHPAPVGPVLHAPIFPPPGALSLRIC